MGGCVGYIHDPDKTLTFDLKVKFKGFLTWLCVRAAVFLSLDIVIQYLTHDLAAEIQGRIQEFQNGGGRGPGAVVFLDVSFALMPLQTYPMFLLEE